MQEFKLDMMSNQKHVNLFVELFKLPVTDLQIINISIDFINFKYRPNTFCLSCAFSTCKNATLTQDISNASQQLQRDINQRGIKKKNNAQ
jgi:hypothetical protein